MGSGRDIVITVYGHEKIIDRIAVNSFESEAEIYCDTINALELKDNSWVYAKKISENEQYSLDSFFPIRFDIILKLDNRSIQKVLREADSQEIAKALKGEKDDIKEKIFSNMSKRAAQMLKEDMEYMGAVEAHYVKESQEKIVNLIRILAEIGEIIIQPRGELIV